MTSKTTASKTTAQPRIRCAECEGTGREVYTKPNGGLSTQTCVVCDGQGTLPICCVCGDEWCDREMPSAADLDAAR